MPISFVGEAEPTRSCVDKSRSSKRARINLVGWTQSLINMDSNDGLLHWTGWRDGGRDVSGSYMDSLEDLIMSDGIDSDF